MVLLSFRALFSGVARFLWWRMIYRFLVSFGKKSVSEIINSQLRIKWTSWISYWNEFETILNLLKGVLILKIFQGSDSRTILQFTFGESLRSPVITVPRKQNISQYSHRTWHRTGQHLDRAIGKNKKLEISWWNWKEWGSKACAKVERFNLSWKVTVEVGYFCIKLGRITEVGNL